MTRFPAHIPTSLQSYVEQFDEDPDKAIDRLRGLLAKRGPDAVGYYLLAWLCYRNEERTEAIRAAWKAKIFAPGSPAMETLHYFMTHPDKQNAWKPKKLKPRHRPVRSAPFHTHSINDLDELIGKLSSVETRRIRLSSAETDEPEPDLAADSASVDDIVTETLARIHENQGNLRQAIRTYEKLIGLNGEQKKTEYEARIRELRSRIEEEEESS